MNLTGAQILWESLVREGVDTVFGHPGGAVLPLYDALHAQPRLRHVLVRHEQAAIHAAEGYARSTGRVCVVFVTSGPGVANTISGLLAPRAGCITFHGKRIDSLPAHRTVGEGLAHVL